MQSFRTPADKVIFDLLVETGVAQPQSEPFSGKRETTMKFTVNWSKTYCATGSLVVEAADKAAAESIVANRIGDLVGSVQYVPAEDTVDAIPVEANNVLQTDST